MQYPNGTIITTLVPIQVNRIAKGRFRVIESSYVYCSKRFFFEIFLTAK